VNAPGAIDPAPIARARCGPGAEPVRTVRVGIACVGAWASRIDSLTRTLDDRERARVARMRFERDRAALAVAYGLHREMLADELGIPPNRVPVYRDGAGRPRIAGDAVWTSLSHASDWVAIAIDRVAPVGVDIEPLTRVAAVAEVAEAILHPDERLPAGMRDAECGLLALWVRKEAVLKAAGVGLRVPMDTFPALQVDAVRVPGIEGEWRVHDLRVDAPVHAAVATCGRVHVACSVMGPPRRPNATIAFASAS
jgi:4'-phosphopantetheinyl transferase